MQVVESVANPDQKVKPLGGPPFEMGMGQRYQTENISKPRTAKELHIHGLAYSSQATVFREALSPTGR